MNVLIAIAAGCAAGLMFASVISGALLSIVLVYLAPLPLMVAALGWGPATALLGGIGAGVGLGLIFNFFYGLGFVLTIAIPAFWLGHLSLLARPASQPSSASSETHDAALDWYPVGRLLLWIASIAMLIMIFFLLTTGSSGEEITGKMRDHALRAINTVSRSGASAEDKERMALFIARALPIVGVSTTMLMYLLNLWLAGRITQTSRRLRRPWPNLHDIELPQTAIVVLAAALLLSFAGGLPAIVAHIVGAALLTAYTLVGFAVLHAVTRPGSGRWGWRLAAYALIVLVIWPVVLVAMLGLLEGTVGLRRRFANRVKPPTLSS
jgi:hypothetical protein